MHADSGAAGAPQPPTYAAKQRAYRKRLRARLIRAQLTFGPDVGTAPLRGSTKQIEWAEEIRAAMIHPLLRLSDIVHVDRQIRRHLTLSLQDFAGISHLVDVVPRITAAELRQAIERLASIESAHFWIENRGCTPAMLIANLVQDLPPSSYRRAANGAAQELDRANLLAEATLRPEGECSCSDVVEMAMPTPNRIRIAYPGYSPEFNARVKARRFGWDKPYWVRSIDVTEDVFVEVATALLGCGYSVRILDDRLRAKVAGGEYEPEPERFVEAHSTDRGVRFRVKWRSGDEDERKISGRLSRSKVAKVFDDAAFVPAKHYDLIIDLAASYGFVIKPTAQALIDAGQVALLKAKPVAAKPRRYDHGEAKDGLPAATGEIDESLLDD